MKFPLSAAVITASLALCSAAFAAPITGVPGSWDGVFVAPNTGATMLGWGFGRGAPGTGNPSQGNPSQNNPGSNLFGGNNGFPGAGGNAGSGFAANAGGNTDWPTGGNNDAPGNGNNDGPGNGNNGSNGNNGGSGDGNGGESFAAAAQDISVLAVDDPVAIPEPLTLAMFGAGLVGAAAMRRRKKPA